MSITAWTRILRIERGPVSVGNRAGPAAISPKMLRGPSFFQRLKKTESASHLERLENETRVLRTQLAEERESKLCIICQSGTRAVVLMPCKHFALCEDCLALLPVNILSRKVCPVCRTQVDKTIRVYLWGKEFQPWGVGKRDQYYSVCFLCQFSCWNRETMVRSVFDIPSVILLPFALWNVFFLQNFPQRFFPPKFSATFFSSKIFRNVFFRPSCIVRQSRRSKLTIRTSSENRVFRNFRMWQIRIENNMFWKTARALADKPSERRRIQSQTVRKVEKRQRFTAERAYLCWRALFVSATLCTADYVFELWTWLTWRRKSKLPD